MQIEILVIIAVFALITLARLTMSRRRGRLGETRVNRVLGRLPRNDFVVLYDLLIWSDGRSSQIDHIVVSRFGIFVIETKNFTGWIHGNEDSEYWVQTIYGNRTRFPNPIRQNWSHVRAIKNILRDFPRLRYFPVVVFAGSAELKNVRTETPVVYLDELAQTIMDRMEELNLTSEETDSIVRRLNGYNTEGRPARRQHVRETRERTRNRRQIEQSLVCPKCGGALVDRNGPYGRFYGCSNYPGCRYTVSESKQ